MVKTIVVGVDASADSRCAVTWAAELAEQVGARVVAVHAVGLLEHERGDPRGRHLLPLLDAWTSPLEELDPDLVERRLVVGDPVSALCHAVADTDADLVVVGSRGEGAHGGTVLGSTSMQLTERCPRPVVIVPVFDGPRETA